MNHAMHKEAEDRRKHMLVLMERVRTEWVSADYLRHRLSCSKQQARRDIELLQNDKLVLCCQLLDIRKEGVGESDESVDKPRTSKTVIVKLTGRGRKKAEGLPPWIVNI